MGGPKLAHDIVFRDIENINTSFHNSGIQGTVKVVRTETINSDEFACQAQMLDRILNSNEPNFVRLREMKAEVNADIVIIVVNESSQCGIAASYGDMSRAFLLVHYECLGKNYSMARQMGYLLGCGNLKSESGRFNTVSNTAYAYSYEDEDGKELPPYSFTTIMGYTDEKNSGKDDDFNLIPYWSSSTVLYDNKPTGDPSHDNAAEISHALKQITVKRVPYGNQHIENEVLEPYELIKAGSKRKYELSGMTMEPLSECEIRSQKIQLTGRVLIKAGSKVRLVIE
jgi:hypothetical protein